jgi:phage shock protein C
MQRKLYRSQTDTMFGGVCGGLAEFFGIDASLVRLGFVLGALLGGHTILLYIIMLVIVPPAPQTNAANTVIDQ